MEIYPCSFKNLTRLEETQQNSLPNLFVIIIESNVLFYYNIDTLFKYVTYFSWLLLFLRKVYRYCHEFLRVSDVSIYQFILLISSFIHTSILTRLPDNEFLAGISIPYLTDIHLLINKYQL